MIYQTTSIKNVISRVVRNLDNKLPGHYLDSMLEWAPEAMEELETPFQFITMSTPSRGYVGEFITSNHVIQLPCGLVSIIAVEDEQGNRVREGGDVTDITSNSARYSSSRNSQGYDNATTTNFQKGVGTTFGADPNTAVPGSSTPWDGSDLSRVGNQNTTAFYKIQAGYLQTSEESMFVKIHYKSLPVDEEGYPLVPDVNEYKEAMYWYIIWKLIGAGFKHPVIQSSMQGLEYCKQQYELYAGRALGKIRMPTQDTMARLRDGFSQRLVPPHHFYEDFSIGSEQVQTINR